MACTLETTTGGASANSYCSIADGDSYHETHLYADDWTDADSDQKCKALQSATRLLDQNYEWQGSPTNIDQALRWPRQGAYDADGNLLASDEIPIGIEQGTAELARLLIAGDRTAESDTAVQGITSVTAGDVAVTFNGSASTSRPIPDSVAAFVSQYGVKKGPSGGAVVMKRA
jgi:hypothetical protein